MSVSYPSDSRPHIQMRHIDGPVLWMRDGRLHWLTIWERIAVRFGWHDAYSLERKHRGRRQMSDTDRELLELAAKAAGHALVWGEKYAIGGDLVDCTDMPYIKSVHPDELDAYWNPLTDDGDALRLAVKLGLTICNDHESAGSVCCTRGDTEEFPAVMSGKVGDPPGITPEDYAATRRAIVRAAAVIGGGK